jgi:hypothetical protein
MSEIIKLEDQKLTLENLLEVPAEIPQALARKPEEYAVQMDAAIELAKSLTHEISADGRKKAKDDVAMIRRYSKGIKGYALDIFRTVTATASQRRDLIYSKSDELNAIADGIMPKFEAHEKAILDNVKSVVDIELNIKWGHIRPEFRQGDTSSLIKLSGTLTEGGKLTKKANDFIFGIVNDCQMKQQQHDNRCNIIKIKCLESEINPPFLPAYLGTAFNGTEEDFNSKLDELVGIEITRRAEMEAKIIKQQEAKKQQEINAALAAQQAEADRLAKEKLEAERQADFDNLAMRNHERANRIAEAEREAKLQTRAEPTSEELRESAARIEQAAQYADRKEDARRELQLAEDLKKQAEEIEQNAASIEPGKRLARFNAEFSIGSADMLSELPDDLKKILTGMTLHFEVKVPELVSNAKVESHFKNKLPKIMADKLSNVVFYND